MLQVAKKASWKAEEGTARPLAAGGAEKPGQPCLVARTPESHAPISQACPSPEASLQSSGEALDSICFPLPLHVDCMPTHDKAQSPNYY